MPICTTRTYRRKHSFLTGARFTLYFDFFQEGGALWIGVSGVVEFLEGSEARFLYNSGYGNGGAVYNGGVLVMRDTAEFNQGRSTSGGSGGCIYFGPSAEAV